MLVKSQKRITMAVYDSVLQFGIEYVENYNMFCCRIKYDNNHGSVDFVRPAIGLYIIKRLEMIDSNRNSWATTDRLLWATINNLNWIN